MIGKKFFAIFSIAACILLIFAVASSGLAASASAPAVYTNADYGFSLTIPVSWEGLYRVDESATGVSFINIRNENVGVGGYLFGIYISDNTEPIDWGFRELLKADGKYYYIHTPTDVQFAYEDESLYNEYTTMEKDIELIIESFRFDTSTTADTSPEIPTDTITVPEIPANTVTVSEIPTDTVTVLAMPTASTVLVNKTNVSFDAYSIEDYNYFKLRDLAFILNGTVAQFEVGWDEANNAIALTTGEPYTVVGGEMASKGAGGKIAYPTDSTVFLNGRETNFTAYNIEGNNYFKLRDIGQAMDFGVDWDDAAQTIAIDTSLPYTPERVIFSEEQAKKIFFDALIAKWNDVGVTESLLNNTDETKITVVGVSLIYYQGSEVYCLDVSVFRTMTDRALVFVDGNVIFYDDPDYDAYKYMFNVDIV